jgi:hypothetical protein
MNTLNLDPSTDEFDLQQSQMLQQQILEILPQLSPERLQTVLDFVAYLANQESVAATQELTEIPGLLETLKKTQATPKTQYTNWRTIRSDV